MMRVLIVDDDLALIDVLSFTMRRAGYEVIPANDGLTALERWKAESPDLVILDLNLSGMDGLEVCRQIRAMSDIPIVILSVRDREEDIIAGLKSGADDYITKPFSPRQLVARAESVLRPYSYPSIPTELPELLKVGPVTFNPYKKVLQFGEQKKAYLTRLESRMVEILIRHCGDMVSYQELLEYVWGPKRGDLGALRELAYSLRRKVEEQLAIPLQIDQVNGEGYSLSPGENQVKGA
jgi:DNA-binding response OmpR family regulator